MFKILYLIWALLPATLFFMSARASVRRVINAQGREYPVEYLKPAIFCTVFLAVAILIDTYMFQDIVDYFGFQETDLRVIAWLIYPALLSIAAMIQNVFVKKKEREEDEVRKTRLRNYINR
jgi:hypothetical protein